MLLEFLPSPSTLHLIEDSSLFLPSLYLTLNLFYLNQVRNFTLSLQPIGINPRKFPVQFPLKQRFLISLFWKIGHLLASFPLKSPHSSVSSNTIIPIPVPLTHSSSFSSHQNLPKFHYLRFPSSLSFLAYPLFPFISFFFDA